MPKSRVFARDSKKRVKQAPKKQTEVGERAATDSLSRASSKSPSVSESRAVSKSPKERSVSKSPKQRPASKSPKQRSASKSPKQRSASKSPKPEKSPKAKSPSTKKSKSKKKHSPSPSTGKGLLVPKKIIVIIIQALVVFLAMLGLFLAIYYLSPHYHLGLDIVPALGGDRLYYAADLSCYTLFGFKPKCTGFSTRWEEYGCSKRKTLVIVGAVFGGVGLACAIAVLVFLILLLLHVIQLPIVTFIIAVVAAVLITVAWIMVVVIYSAKMCPTEETEEAKEEDPEVLEAYAMKDFTTIGPGFIFLLFSSLLQVLSAILIFFWMRYLIE